MGAVIENMACASDGMLISLEYVPEVKPFNVLMFCDLLYDMLR